MCERCTVEEAVAWVLCALLAGWLIGQTWSLVVSGRRHRQAMVQFQRDLLDNQDEVTPDGVRVHGSSPRARREFQGRLYRARMRGLIEDHEHEGTGRYCRAMGPPWVAGSPETGVVTMTVACGMPRSQHIGPEPEGLLDPGEGLLF